MTYNVFGGTLNYAQSINSEYQLRVSLRLPHYDAICKHKIC